jgi:hypothetical protein
MSEIATKARKLGKPAINKNLVSVVVVVVGFCHC